MAQRSRVVLGPVLPALMVAIGFLGSLPGSAAQSTAMEVELELGAYELPGGRLPPETTTLDVPIAVTIAYPEPIQNCQDQVHVDFTVTRAPEYANATVLPETYSVLSQTQASPDPEEARRQRLGEVAELKIQTTRQAPALAEGVYEFQARAYFDNAPQCAWTEGSASEQVTVVNDFVASMIVEPMTYTVASDNKDVAIFPVTVTNLGNGPARIETEIFPGESGPEHAFGTPPLALGAEATDGAGAETSGLIEVRVMHNGSGGRGGFFPFETEFTLSYGGNASAGLDTDTQRVALTLEIKPFLKSPAPHPLLGFPLLLALVAAQRRWVIRKRSHGKT